MSCWCAESFRLCGEREQASNRNQVLEILRLRQSLVRQQTQVYNRLLAITHSRVGCSGRSRSGRQIRASCRQCFVPHADAPTLHIDTASAKIKFITLSLSSNTLSPGNRLCVCQNLMPAWSSLCLIAELGRGSDDMRSIGGGGHHFCLQVVLR